MFYVFVIIIGTAFNMHADLILENWTQIFDKKGFTYTTCIICEWMLIKAIKIFH